MEVKRKTLNITISDKTSDLFRHKNNSLPVQYIHVKYKRIIYMGIPLFDPSCFIFIIVSQQSLWLGLLLPNTQLKN